MGQYASLVIGMAITSFLSILGSVAVTRIAYLKLTSTYQRFLFMLSLTDILNAVFLLFHQLVLPESPNFYWAVGNSKSCSMAGFFLHFGSLSVAMYSCYLSAYFFFSIQSSPKRQKQPEDIIGFWEWCAHLSSLLLPGGIAAAAAVTSNVNVDQGLGLCVIQSYECMDGTANQADCVSVENGDWALPKDTNALRWAYIAGMLASAFFGVMATLMVYCRVQGTLSKSADAADSMLPDEMKHRLRAVATQAVLYSMVFVNSMIWPILTVVVPTDTDSTIYPLHLLTFLMYPLQGLLNCLIYIRPRYQMLRTMYPNDSMTVVFRVSMSKAGDPDEIEEVRERIYGDAYEQPSVVSSVHSLASDMPNEVVFDPNKALSTASLVSVPGDDDDMDPEAIAKSVVKEAEDTKST